jgi:hypothetical protein
LEVSGFIANLQRKWELANVYYDRYLITLANSEAAVGSVSNNTSDTSLGTAGILVTNADYKSITSAPGSIKTSVDKIAVGSEAANPITSLSDTEKEGELAVEDEKEPAFYIFSYFPGGGRFRFYLKLHFLFSVLHQKRLLQYLSFWGLNFRPPKKKKNYVKAEQSKKRKK